MLFFAIPHRSLRLCGLAVLASATICPPALASNITVGSPAKGVRLTSPLWIRAHNIGCEGVPPTVFGYSIDDSRTFIRGESAYDIDITGQYLSAGVHTVHFKAWTARGLCPVVSTRFVVAGPYVSSSSSSSVTSSSPAIAAVSSSTQALSESRGDFGAVLSLPLSGGTVSNEHTAPVSAEISPAGSPTTSPAYGLPANAVSSGDLDSMDGWAQIHDGGTPGTSRGSTVYPATTPANDNAREFYMTYTKHGGERWDITPVSDENATHFVLDTYVYLPDPSQVMNLELDINQVTSNGETVILATQCAGNDGTWEAGYARGKKNDWWEAHIKCDPRTWTANTWHHIQIGLHHSGDTVTHDWVILDGVYHPWGYTHEIGRFSGWQPGSINVQYQIEGNNKTSGSITTYLHKLTVYRW
jgi:hypothetical protein